MSLLELGPDELLSTTRAVRKRLDFTKPVPDDLIRECVALALQAPSGSNQVAMRFVVVRDPEKIAAVAGVYKQCWDMYATSPTFAGARSERDTAEATGPAGPRRRLGHVPVGAHGRVPGVGDRLHHQRSPGRCGRGTGGVCAQQHPSGDVELHAGRPGPGPRHGVDHHPPDDGASRRRHRQHPLRHHAADVPHPAGVTPREPTSSRPMRSDPDTVIEWR